jgi:DNA-binding transcriptional ArsR family regulator
LEYAEQAVALLNPVRSEILRMLDQPASASEVGRLIGEPPQKVNYHIKSLEKVGLVRRSGTRQVRNLVEVLYLAVARTFVIPDTFGWTEELQSRMKSQGALKHLITAAERIRRDVVQLMDASTDDGGEIPSATLELQVKLRDEATRETFVRDYTRMLGELTERYGGAAADSAGHEANVFRIVAAVYPRVGDEGGTTNGE